MFLIVSRVGSGFLVAVFPQDAATQRNVLLDDAPSSFLGGKDTTAHHARQGPSPSTRVAINLTGFVHSLVLV